MSREVKTRSEAKKDGDPRYFTGVPCLSGHVSERVTSNGSCCECTKIRRREKYHKNIEKEKERQKKYRQSEKGRARKARILERDKKDNPKKYEEKERKEEERRRKQQAKDEGRTTYVSTLLCKHDHPPIRFLDSKCVECNRIQCLGRYNNKVNNQHVLEYRKHISRIRNPHDEHVKEFVRRCRVSEKENFSSAEEKGETVAYTLFPCRVCGGTERRVSNRECYPCSRERATSEEKREYYSTYYYENKERISIRGKEYYKENRERYTEVNRKWADANPEKVKVIKNNYKHRRRAKEKNGVSTSELHKWIEEQEKRCFYCHEECYTEFHIDHVIPLSKGGLHELFNMKVSCPNCNLRKSASDPVSFCEEYGFVHCIDEVLDIMEESSKIEVGSNID